MTNGMMKHSSDVISVIEPSYLIDYLFTKKFALLKNHLSLYPLQKEVVEEVLLIKCKNSANNLNKLKDKGNIRLSPAR